MSEMEKPEPKILILTSLLLANMACRPIITIGWSEIGILIALILILLGPPLFRLYQRFDEFQDWKARKGKKKEED